MRLGHSVLASPLLFMLLVAGPSHAEPPTKGGAEPAPTPSQAEPPTKGAGEPVELLEPAEAPEEEAPEFPPESTRWKLVLGGLGVTAAWYGAAAGISYVFPDAPGAHDLRTPIVGPWQAIANNGCSADEPDCSGIIVALRSIVTAIDGLGQAAGPLLMLEGIFLPTAGGEPARSPRREPAAPRPGSAPSSQPPAPAPTDGTKNLFFFRPSSVGLRGVGLAVSGTF